MDQLYEFMQRQLARTTSNFHHYLYSVINWENQMLGLVGSLGIGKTTLFFQRIKQAHSLNDTLYISADHMYFASHSLFDAAETFYKNGGKYLFIDEVHKYPSWSRELKAIYDSFSDMHVYFIGSSVLDIEKGEADLSRRAPKYLMQRLSFREFLAIQHGIDAPVFSLKEILNQKAQVPQVKHPLPYFNEYIKNRYYPFGADVDFDIKLEQVISRTLEVDIPQFANMNTSTGRKLKELMAIVSTLAPFKPNMTKLGSQVQASRNSINDYLGYMEKAGMIAQLQTNARGLGALGKIEKVYLDNTNILYCLSNGSVDIGTVRETFFLNQMRANHRVTSSTHSDFCIDGMTFEVGGKSKGRSQLKGVENGFVVKDSIEYGHGNVVPLWAFGLNY